MSNRRTKIGFLSSADPYDRKRFSGTPYSILNALQKHCGDIISLGPVNYEVGLMSKCINKLTNTFFEKKYNFTHSIMLSRQFSKNFISKITSKNINIIFAPFASTAIAFLETNIPIIYLSDTTFKLLTNYYDDYKHLSLLSVFEGNLIEQLSINKSRQIIFSSEWAAKSAIRDYGASPEKIHVIPFGPNIETVPSLKVILDKKKPERCRLLFVGKSNNWKRKGGHIAYETLLKLEEAGFKAELIVCGCKPPSEFTHKWMKVIPFLNKNDEDSREKLNQLFLNADLFLLPTRSECFGIVFCEANAYGLPVITTDTGGISSVIENGVNGFMLPESARGMDYAMLIQKIYNNDELYLKLVRNSRKTFDNKLNWDAWGKSVNQIINKVLRKDIL